MADVVGQTEHDDGQPRKRVKTMSLNLDGTWEEDDIDSEEAEELGIRKGKDSDSDSEEFTAWAWKKPQEPPQTIAPVKVAAKPAAEVIARPTDKSDDWSGSGWVDKKTQNSPSNDWSGSGWVDKKSDSSPKSGTDDWSHTGWNSKKQDSSSNASNNNWSSNGWKNQSSNNDWKKSAKWNDWDSSSGQANAVTNASPQQSIPEPQTTLPPTLPPLMVPPANLAAALPPLMTPPTTLPPLMTPPGLQQSAPAEQTPSDASRCIILFPMFNAASVDLVSNPTFFNDVHADVQRECQNFGPVLQVWINPSSQGDVWVHFADVDPAVRCQRALNKRWFGGQQINVEFASEENWKRNVVDTMSHPLD